MRRCRPVLDPILCSLAIALHSTFLVPSSVADLLLEAGVFDFLIRVYEESHIALTRSSYFSFMIVFCCFGILWTC